jgi:hypothetical protein
LITDDFPTLGYPTMPTISLSSGVRPSILALNPRRDSSSFLFNIWLVLTFLSASLDSSSSCFLSSFFSVSSSPESSSSFYSSSSS